MIAGPAQLLIQRVKPLEVMGAPVMVILAGMLLALIIPLLESAKEGTAFVSKNILQAAVVLLGARLNLSTAGRIGGRSLPIILSTIATSLVVALILQKLLHVPVRTATPVGVGSLIRGRSAMSATAPVIGADDCEIAQAISVIFLFNVIASIIFSGQGNALGLSNEIFGLFAGTASNDTSSVTAAAST